MRYLVVRTAPWRTPLPSDAPTKLHGHLTPCIQRRSVNHAGPKQQPLLPLPEPYNWFFSCLLTPTSLLFHECSDWGAVHLIFFISNLFPQTVSFEKYLSQTMVDVRAYSNGASHATAKSSPYWSRNYLSLLHMVCMQDFPPSFFSLYCFLVFRFWLNPATLACLQSRPTFFGECFLFACYMGYTCLFIFRPNTLETYFSYERALLETSHPDQICSCKVFTKNFPSGQNNVLPLLIKFQVSLETAIHTI